MKPLLSLLFPLIVVQSSAQPSSPAVGQAQAVNGSNAFAVDLYAQLRAQPGNLFFSPESISTAFAMAYAGAQGQTATEMAKVFHFTLPADKLHPAMATLLKQMNAQHSAYELHVADALWAQEGKTFLPGYLNLVQTDYGAGFHPVDFKASPDNVRAAINAWVEQQTNNKITDLIGPGAINATTRLVLTNAVYFKSAWLSPFEAGATQSEEFHLSDAQQMSAPLMHRTGSYNYFDGGTFQVLEMPYAAGKLSMIVFLPKTIDGLPALEHSFTATAANEWVRKLQPAAKVVLMLPRFKMTQQFELSGTLSTMGMPQAFGNSANFAGMTGKPDFSISAAIHKAYIDVDENGTEAAAATGIVMYATAMRNEPPPPPPIVFRADHPFLFLIRDNSSGAILFMGRVADPTK